MILLYKIRVIIQLSQGTSGDTVYDGPRINQGFARWISGASFSTRQGMFLLPLDATVTQAMKDDMAALKTKKVKNYTHVTHNYTKVDYMNITKLCSYLCLILLFAVISCKGPSMRWSKFDLTGLPSFEYPSSLVIDAESGKGELKYYNKFISPDGAFVVQSCGFYLVPPYTIGTNGEYIDMKDTPYEYVIKDMKKTYGETIISFSKTETELTLFSVTKRTTTFHKVHFDIGKNSNGPGINYLIITHPSVGNTTYDKWRERISKTWRHKIFDGGKRWSNSE